MDDILLVRFQQLIADRTGINAAREPAELRRIIDARANSLGLSQAGQYLDLLAARSPAADAEWSELAAVITNGESHFFRDQGQMALLRDEILPELIARNRHLRRLRIWSAGCSTGEEPYSLAILLNELLPPPHNWEISILGSDINPSALVRARRGLYGNWSFRLVDPEIKSRYFRAHGAQWEVRGDIRAMVTFASGNIHDAHRRAARDMGAFDLIICRNVFIYFERSAVAAAIATFAGALTEGGYLITGHGELSGHDLRGLRTRRFLTSIVYQRPLAHADAAGATSPQPPAPTPVRLAKKSVPGGATPRPQPAPGRPRPAAAPRSEPSADARRDAIVVIEALVRSGACTAAIEMGEEVLRTDPRNARVLALVARALADRGRYADALERAAAAIAADPLAVDPYFLTAHIAEDRGDLEGAKKIFRSILYIAPSSVGAYLHMADIHQCEGDHERARGMRRTALALLEKMDPAAEVSQYGESNVRGLISQLRKALGAGGPGHGAGLNRI